MPTARLILAAVVLAAIMFPPAAAAGQSTATNPAADVALEPILRDFRNLYESLRNKLGMEPEDREVVRGLRDRGAAFNNQ